MGGSAGGSRRRGKEGGVRGGGRKRRSGHKWKVQSARKQCVVAVTKLFCRHCAGRAWVLCRVRLGSLQGALGFSAGRAWVLCRVRLDGWAQDYQ